MKIAYLSTFYPFRGGIAQFNEALTAALKVDNVVNTYTFKRQYPDILFPGTSQYVDAQIDPSRAVSPRILDTINPFTYLSAAKIIRQQNPDLVLTKFWMPFFAPSLGTVYKKLKRESVTLTILDNVIPHERRTGDIALIKYFLRQNRGFVAMSEKVKSDLLSLRPDAPVLLHPHPLYDHFGKKINKQEARKKIGISEEKKVLLFFGFIRDYKGLDNLLRAVQQLDASYHLCIAGEVYGSFETYDALIREYNLGDRVSINTRYISDVEVPLFFSAADVCILPYKSATQSGITSIAYHFDLPVIATNVGGLAEYIEDTKTGLIVKGTSVSDLTSSIRSFFEVHNKQYIESEIKKMKAHLSWTNLAKEITRFAQTLTTKKV